MFKAKVAKMAEDAEDNAQAVYTEIYERKYQAAFHNGWTCINRKGLANS